MPEGFWPEFWSAAKSAGLLGTIIMAGAWWVAREDLKQERQLGATRHLAIMDALNSIKMFMEVIKDRFPRT